MNFMKKLSDHVNNAGTLRAYLHDQMAGYDEPRSRLITHASDLTNDEVEFCPRERALQLYTGSKSKGRYIDPCLTYTFAMGHYMAEMLIEEWLGDIVVGDWVCTHCKMALVFSKRPKVACKNCGGTHWKYKEIRVKDETTGVSCGLDLLVKLPNRPKLQLIEIKTMIKDQWKALKAPLAEHRLRTNLYLRVASGSDYRNQIDTKQGILFYMIKGYGGSVDEDLSKEGITDKMTPFKEFVVTRNDEDTEIYFKKGRAVQVYKDTGVAPEGVCETYDCKRAKSCEMRAKCFSGDFKSGGLFPLDIEVFK